MAKQTYTIGQVLAASEMTTLQANDYNQTVSAKVASYTLVASDAGTRITMSNASATTITVNTRLFTAGDTLLLTNIGAGVCTVTAGTATVSTSATLALAQYDSGTLYFTSTGVSIFFASDAADGMANPLTTTGDIIYSSSGTTAARLGIGSSAQILTVASGVPSWATPAASASGLTLIVKSSFTGITSHSLNNCFSATYDCYKVIVTFTASTGTGIEISYKLRSSSTDNSADYAGTHLYAFGTTVGAQANGALGTDEFFAGSSGAAVAQYTSIVSDINTPFKSQPTTFLSRSSYGTSLVFNNNNVGYHNNSNSFDGLTLIGSSGTLTGTIYVYGMAI